MEALPQLINGYGKTAIVCNTGTGKTLAAMIAVLNSVDTNQNKPQALYLCTTYEAAYEAKEIMSQAARYTQVTIGLVTKGAQGTYGLFLLLNFVRSNVPSLKLSCTFSAHQGEKIDDHVVVGTPKEITAYVITRKFDIEKISICVCDDADEILTTQMVKTYIVDRLRSCRMIMVSATSLKSVISGPCTWISNSITLNCTQSFIKTGNSVALKMEVILDVYQNLMKYGNKAIVFVSVRIIWITFTYLCIFATFVSLLKYDSLCY